MNDKICTNGNLRLNASLGKLLALMLAGLLVFVPAGVALAGAQARQPVKDETIYVKMNLDGSVKGTYVVNSFELDAESEFVDYGSYVEVKNLTTTDTLTTNDGAISISAPKGRFYYQGTLEPSELPWDIGITYTLDGEPIDADALAGKSGRLAIALDIKAHTGTNPVFNERYMLQISLTLDGTRCRGISADNATVVTAGKNQVITFMHLPETDGQYKVSMDATDFEMDGIQITGIPFSMGFDMPQLEDLTRMFTELTAGIQKLDEGATGLAGGGGQLGQAYDRLHKGLSDMQAGLSQLTSGISELAEQGDGLRNGSGQILDALILMRSSIDSYNAAIDGLGELSKGSSSVLAGISQIANGLSALSGSFAQADQGISGQTGGLYPGLREANEAVIESLNRQIEALQANPSANAAEINQLSLIVGLLNANNGLVAGLETGIAGDLSPANPGLAAAANTLATEYAKLDAAIQNMPKMLSEMAVGITQLKGGVDQMVASYTAFNGGLGRYLAGVSQVKDGLVALSSGFDGLTSGSKEFQAGLSSLNQGLRTYSKGTSEMRAGLQNTDLGDIEGLLDTYLAGDFEPVSFVSARNEQVGSVQFIMMTDGIRVIEAAKAVEPEAPAKTFWERFLDLFR